MVRRELSRWDLAALEEGLTLLASELGTNALQHGGGCEDFRLVRTADGVRIEVRQAVPGTPHVSRAAADEERGRGMLIVASVADAWGVSEDGRTVWCSLTARSTEPLT